MVEICIKLFVIKDLGLFFILFDFAAIYYTRHGIELSGISEQSNIFLTEA